MHAIKVARLRRDTFKPCGCAMCYIHNSLSRIPQPTLTLCNVKPSKRKLLAQESMLAGSTAQRVDRTCEFSYPLGHSDAASELRVEHCNALFSVRRQFGREKKQGAVREFCEKRNKTTFNSAFVLGRLAIPNSLAPTFVPLFNSIYVQVIVKTDCAQLAFVSNCRVLPVTHSGTF